MSEFPDSRELFPKAVAPQTWVGAASPLWGLFAGAAATGVAWWWMTRWTRPQNVEALFGAAEAEALVEVDLPVLAVGGESAPMGALVEAAVEAEEPVAAPAPEAVVEVAPQPAPQPAATPKTPAEPRSVAPKSRPAAQLKAD